MPYLTTQCVEPGLLLTGLRLARGYDIGARLACGSYAEVFTACELATGAVVVVKALNPLLQGACEAELAATLVENLKLEAAALKRLRHPHIVELLAQGEAFDLTGRAFHYLVLEYLSGGTLASLARGQRLPLAQSLGLLAQVSAALSHVHERGVLHRDVKPDNVLLTADQRVAKLADFGVARVNRWDGDITQVGSGCYAAPEHFTRAGATVRLTLAADVYALAKTAYFLICGEAPRAFAQRPITAWPAEFDESSQTSAVLRVIRRATATAPRARQQSVAVFWSELEKAVRPLLAESVEVEVEERRPAPRSRIVIDATRKPAPARKTGKVQSNAVARVRRQPSPQHDYRSAVVWFLFLLVCAGLLRTVSAIWQEKQQGPIRSAVVMPQGRLGVTMTEVNIRLDDSTRHPPIGLAERASQVRVLAVRGEWYLIKVVQHARPKVTPLSADQGWVHSHFVMLNDEAHMP